LPATPAVAGIVLGCTNATNAALGCNALLSNAGTGNVAIGLSSLTSNTTGVNNVAIGNCAFSTNTGGSGNVAIDTAVVARKYSESNGALTATSGSVTWAVSHGLDTRDVTAPLFDLDNYEQVEVDVVRTNDSTVTLSWVSGNVSADSYRVVIVG
jgi:hypothetical protein